MNPVILARFPDPTSATASLTVNVDAVDAVASLPTGRAVIYLRGGAKLTVPVSHDEVIATLALAARKAREDAYAEGWQRLADDVMNTHEVDL